MTDEICFAPFFFLNLSLFSLSLCHNCLSHAEMKASMMKICTLLCRPLKNPTKTKEKHPKTHFKQEGPVHLDQAGILLSDS